MPKMVNFKLTATGQFWMPDEAGGGGGGSSAYGIDTLGAVVGYIGKEQVAWEFSTDVPITVTGLRAYGRSVGDETLRLWRVSDASLLGSVTVTSEESAWVEGELAAPIALPAGNYRVGMRRVDGASRTYWGSTGSDHTYHPNVSYQQGYFVDGDGYPNSLFSAKCVGIADIVFTVD